MVISSQTSSPTDNVLGVTLAPIDYHTAISEIEKLARLPRPSAVSFCNTHLIAEAADNKTFRDILAGFDLNLPDGMPLIWILKYHGHQLSDRVYGPYLMKAFFESGRSDPGLRHFLFGSTPQVLEKLRAALLKMNPHREIVGSFSPPFRSFTDDDIDAIVNAINAPRPDCIWVALGGVRQETWIAENLHRFPKGVFLAVGDAFTLLAGEGKFAPKWMQKAGLTWLYRLATQPRRLGKRYLVYNTLFLIHLVRSIFKS